MTHFLPEGYLINTRENDARISSLDGFIAAFNERAFVEARADYCDCDHNLHIDLGFIEGIIPREECAMGIAEGQTKDIAIIARVNKPVKFIIERIVTEDDKKIAYLSRRKAQEIFTNEYFSRLTPGDIIEATVTHHEQFGAFCDIGCGVNALLPIDNISVSRIPHPSARFNIGDSIKAIIRGFDEQGRAILTHKELLGTWEENASLFRVGETVSGVIRSVESYGIFVELTPNLSGLAEFTEGVHEGDYASVYIKSIIPEKMKFKLVIVDAFKADYKPDKPRYFYDADHIDSFCYSPADSTKIIETTF